MNARHSFVIFSFPKTPLDSRKFRPYFLFAVVSGNDNTEIIAMIYYLVCLYVGERFLIQA